MRKLLKLLVLCSVSAAAKDSPDDFWQSGAGDTRMWKITAIMNSTAEVAHFRPPPPTPIWPRLASLKTANGMRLRRLIALHGNGARFRSRQPRPHDKYLELYPNSDGFSSTPRPQAAARVALPGH